MLVAIMIIAAAINGGLYLGAIAYSNFEIAKSFDNIPAFNNDSKYKI